MRSHLEAASDPGPHGEARCGSGEPKGGKRGGRCQDAAAQAQGYHSTTTLSVTGGGPGERDREGPSAFSSGYPCLACQKHINCSESDGFSQQVVSSFEFGRMGWHRRPR